MVCIFIPPPLFRKSQCPFFQVCPSQTANCDYPGWDQDGSKKTRQGGRGSSVLLGLERSIPNIIGDELLLNFGAKFQR